MSRRPRRAGGTSRSSPIPQRFRVLLILAGALILAVAGWVAYGQLRDAGARPDRITVITRSGEHVFTVEWATTAAERARGLMFRESLAPDHGMVFDFLIEQEVSFWMKDTPLSLDIVFIRENGTVARIARSTVPYSERLIPSGTPVRYVLEVVAGTADRIGLIGGDRVRLQ